jgi:hypothetical protein
MEKRIFNLMFEFIITFFSNFSHRFTKTRLQGNQCSLTRSMDAYIHTTTILCCFRLTIPRRGLACQLLFLWDMAGFQGHDGVPGEVHGRGVLGKAVVLSVLHVGHTEGSRAMLGSPVRYTAAENPYIHPWQGTRPL